MNLLDDPGTMVLGVPLLPYTLGHDILIRRHTILARPIPSNMSAMDLAAAVAQAAFICAQTWTEFHGPTVLDRLLHLFRRDWVRFDPMPEAKRLLTHMTEGGYRLGGAFPEAPAATSLALGLSLAGMDRESILDMPLRQARQIYLARRTQTDAEHFTRN